MSDANNVMVAELRDRAGKGAARATRRAGRVPAVIYGAKRDPILVSVDPLDIKKELDSGALFATAYDVKIGDAIERVLPRDVQFDPVTDVPQHVDFLRVTGATKVTVEVPCIFVNEEESPGLKRGGVLNIVRRAVEFLCSVDNIPQSIEIDLTGLEIGDGVHISNISLPEGVEPTITDRDFTIATIAAPTVVAEEEAAAAEAAAEEELLEGLVVAVGAEGEVAAGVEAAEGTEEEKQED
jgi:large subunit ribosomal protein L25